MIYNSSLYSQRRTSKLTEQIYGIMTKVEMEFINGA